MPRVVTRKIDDRHSLLTVSGYRKGEPYWDTVGMTCCGKKMEELGDGKYRCRCADWTITESHEYDPPLPKHTENKV